MAAAELPSVAEAEPHSAAREAQSAKRAKQAQAPAIEGVRLGSLGRGGGTRNAASRVVTPLVLIWMQWATAAQSIAGENGGVTIREPPYRDPADLTVTSC